MDILPLKFISEEDKPYIGLDLFNLGKLKHLKFPVAEGIIVFPPIIDFTKLFINNSYLNNQLFLQTLMVVKKDFLNIPVPEQFKDELKVNSKRINPQSIWSNLLLNWFDELASLAARIEFKSNFLSYLKPQPIFFVENIASSGILYFDSSIKDSVIKILEGEKLEPQSLKELDKLVVKMNKTLIIPQIYHFIIEKKMIKIVGIKQYTGDLGVREVKDLISFWEGVNSNKSKSNIKKTPTKIYYSLPGNLSLTEDIDGIVLPAEKYSGFDQKVLTLIEAALTFPNSEVLYKLSDIIDTQIGVRGTLNLLHQKEILKEDIQAITFSRNKKQLINISLVIPYVRSIDEFLKIKREIASLGLTRKGNFKIYLELAVPENLINIDEYIQAGIDGAILNLDQQASLIGGFAQEEVMNNFYGNNIEHLFKFIEPGIKLLDKNKIPYLVSGKLALNDNLLKFLINLGVFGIIVELTNTNFIRETLFSLERQTIQASEI